MSRLIDADKIDEKYREIKMGAGFADDEEISPKDAVYFLSLALDAMPTVEPKKGEWDMFTFLYRCNICNAIVDTRGNDEFKFNFCPNCGADMRGEEDG